MTSVMFMCQFHDTLVMLILSLQREVKVALLCLTLYDPMVYIVEYGIPWNSPGQNTGVGSRSL